MHQTVTRKSIIIHAHKKKLELKAASVTTFQPKPNHQNAKAKKEHYNKKKLACLDEFTFCLHESWVIPVLNSSESS